MGFYTNQHSDQAFMKVRVNAINAKLKYSQKFEFYAYIDSDEVRNIVIPKPNILWGATTIAVYKYGIRHEVRHHSEQCRDIFYIKEQNQVRRSVINIVDDYRNDHQHTPYRGEDDILQVGRYEFNAQQAEIRVAEEVVLSKQRIITGAVYALDHEYRKVRNPFLVNQEVTTHQDIIDMVDTFKSKVSYDKYNSMYSIGDVIDIVDILLEDIPEEDTKNPDSQEEEGDGLGETFEVGKPVSKYGSINDYDEAIEHDTVDVYEQISDTFSSQPNNRLENITHRNSNNKVSNLLLGYKTKHLRMNQREGTLNKRALASIPSGNTRLFRKTLKKPNKYVAMSLVLDISFSMKSNYKDVKQGEAILSLARELNNHQEIEYSIGAYNNSYYRIKSFNHCSFNTVRESIKTCGGEGGTSPCEAIYNTVTDLVNHKSPTKVLILTTDGEWYPDQKLKDFIAEANIFTIGIALVDGEDTLKDLGCDYVEVLKDPSEIFDIVYRALSGIFK